MKHSLFFALLIGILLGCKKEGEPDPVAPTPVVPTPVVPTPVDPIITPQKVTGEWVAAQGGGGGFNNFDTFKNYQFNFEVKNANQDVIVGLTSSDINVAYALFDPLGQRIDVSGQSRSMSKLHKLNAGKHRVVVTSDRRAVGKFELTMLGVNGEPVRISSQLLQSETQNWGTLGGGGLDKSFKNHFYTFDITDDNTSIDVELESPDTDISLHLYDELGQLVTKEYGNRYGFKIIAAKKGTYTVMAGTRERGSIGSYRLNVFGKVGNLKRVVSQSTTVSGNWASGGAFDTYTIQITNNNSPLDINLSSADIDVRINLQNSVGQQLDNTCCAVKSTYLAVEKVTQGTYRIMVQSYPSATRRGPGNYTLTVHGQFTDFKKM
ncbi:hypothetical protein ACS5NO_08350 [Larkinella sp. GY13]|uniref:hypothetical protein n=1 Tax=Larkinella sp. GY13 TaxID=3453720 RepID=UPI003EEA9163